MPTVSSLHYPSSRFASRMQPQAFFSPFAWSYMALIILFHHNPVRWRVVEGCIKAQVLWMLDGWARPYHCIVIDQFGQHRSIVYIRSRYYYTQRHSSSITQNVVFYSWFCAICGIGAVFFFPPQATSHRFHQQIATPTRLSASSHTSASTRPRFARRRRLVSTPKIGHRQSARDRTLSALSAKGHQSTGCGAYHRVASDPTSEDVRRAQVVVKAAAVFRSVPKDHRVLVLVLAFQHFIRFLGLQTRS